MKLRPPTYHRVRLFNMEEALKRLGIVSKQYRRKGDERTAWKVDQLMVGLEDLIVIERSRDEVRNTGLTTKSD